MSKTKIFVLLVIIIAIAVMLSRSSNETVGMNNPSMIKEEGGSMQKGVDAKMETGDGVMESGGMMIKKGVYESFSADKLALATDGKVVLFFRATWCPSCKVVDADIRSNLGAIPEGVVILDVDYDNSSDLKKKYGVTYQHTFVQVDASGNQIAKWSGSQTLADLVANIK